MKSGVSLSLNDYALFADDAVKLYKKSKVYDFPREKPQFKIIVFKNADDKPQFYAIEPGNETTILGEGQSTVYLGINLKTGEKVATKKLRAINPAIQEDIHRERENLKITGEFIGEAQEKDDKNVTYYTIMKLHPGVSLIDELYGTDGTKKDLSFQTKLELSLDALSVSKRLHKKMGLLHRDIKTANFQTYNIGKRKVTTLVDLGSALKEGEKKKEIAGSLGYIPPEFLLPAKSRPPYDVLCEIWALGVVLGEIWTKNPYQTLLLDHPDEQVSFADFKKYMSDIFDASQKFDEPEDEKSWKIISKIISEMTKDIEDRDFRLSVSRALKLVRKIYVERTKSEIEKGITLKSKSTLEDASQYAKDKIARYKEMRRNSSPSLPRKLSSPSAASAGVVSPREKILSSAAAFESFRRQSTPYLPSGGLRSTPLNEAFSKLSLEDDRAPPPKPSFSTTQ